MNKPQFDRIEVDLTPLLPGAANGGAKIVVLELIRQFRRIAPNVQFVLLTRARTYDELAELEGDNVSRRLWTDKNQWIEPLKALRGRALRHLPECFHRALYKIRRTLPRKSRHELSQLDYDLLFFPFGLAAPARGFSAPVDSIPSVAVIYDLQHLAYPEFFSADELAVRQRCLELHKPNAKFIVISNFVRQTMIEQVGITPDRVHTAYVQTHTRLPQISSDATRRSLLKYQLESHRYFIYPANFWRHKNHEILFTAFAMARAANLPQNIKLVCTGSPDARMVELQTAVETLGLEHHVLFPGFLADREFAALLRASIGLVFPSLYEGYGMPVIEAMAAGCPVACSGRASLPEIAGDAALLFDPTQPAAVAKAISQLATDEQLRSNLIEKGRSQAARFSHTEEMAREYFTVFEQAARQRYDGLSVTGIYADGWSPPRFSIRVPEGSARRSLHLEVNILDGGPIQQYDFTFEQKRASWHFQTSVQSGKTHLEVPLLETEGRIDVHIRPFFRPCELPRGQANPDTRTLTVIIRKVELHDPTMGKHLVWVP